MTGLGVRS